jgi:hypothetical protein
MIKSLSSSEEVEHATTRSDRLTDQKLYNENGCDRIAGALSIKIPFSENLSKHISPAENEYDVLCQSSSSSNISFGWEEITVNTHPISRHSAYGIERRNSSVNECSNSREQRNRTTENSDSVASIERTLGRDVCCLGITAASKGENNFKESKEGVAHYKHMAVKPAVSEKFVRDIYRMKETHHMSESEDSDSASTCHSRRELYSQKLVLESASSVKSADSSYKKKKVHDVPRREGSGSDSTDDFIEVMQTNGMKTCITEFGVSAILRPKIKHCKLSAFNFELKLYI